jgi:hypothetical protein
MNPGTGAPIISLLTDFGLEDECVAVMKGVIRGIHPEAVVIDISHLIPPFDLCKGAVVFAAALRYLPIGVHVAVVDPGVGTERRALLLKVARGDILLGPDNGLLLPAASRLGGITEARLLQNHEFFISPPHPTFHGRDVFAPVAAHLARGIPPEEMGEKVEASELVPAPWRTAFTGPGSLYCCVIDIDRYGNLRLNAEALHLEELSARWGDELQVDLGEHLFPALLGQTFARAGKDQALLYIDSSGWLGLALREQSLAAVAKVKPLDMAIIYKVIS